MVRYEISGSRKSSTKFIIDSLQNLTVTYVYYRKQAVMRIYSDFEALNSRILRDVVAVSGVSWGRKPPGGTGNRQKSIMKMRCDQRMLKCQILPKSESSVELRVNCQILSF